MRVMVIGRTGQLARELARAEWPKDWSAEFAGRAEIDLRKPESAASVVAARKPDLVMNAAAYTAVDQAESEPHLAMLVNGTSLGPIAAACARLRIPLVTISTDYVFDGGNPRPYTEEDAVCPMSAYGRSKAEGERLVRESHDWHLILRTSWVFSAFGDNFARTMLRLGAERAALSVVADQRGRPTAASDLARAVIHASRSAVQDRTLSGTYHVANAGAVTWHGLAATIYRFANFRGFRIPLLCAISTAEYPTAARRPANSELATGKFERAFGFPFRHWREPLAEVLDELLAAQAAA